MVAVHFVADNSVLVDRENSSVAQGVGFALHNQRLHQTREPVVVEDLRTCMLDVRTLAVVGETLTPQEESRSHGEP